MTKHKTFIDAKYFFLQGDICFHNILGINIIGEKWREMDFDNGIERTKRGIGFTISIATLSLRIIIFPIHTMIIDRDFKDNIL